MSLYYEFEKMSTARCSSCHCYSRNCPPGQPNHKTVATVGPSCTMNQLGRHYRDPLDPTAPHCHYELQGVKCSFFAQGNDLAELPYPEDITLGPVSDPSPPSSDLSAILAILNLQKTEAEQQRVLQQQQAEQMRLLQAQVSSLLQSDRQPASVSAPATTTIVSSFTMTSPAVTTASTLPTFSTFTAPQTVTSAAASLSSAMSGLAPQNSYQGLTMDHLRADPVMMSQAAAVLARATQNVPPLNPLDGMGNSLRNLQNNQVVINSVDQLYRATTVNKQLRCHEFASTGQFSYRHQLKQDNINAVSFAFGAFKHLEACKSGLISVSESEFLARIRHLKNVFEIACLSSKLDSFTETSWLVAREYDTRVISEIESGSKSWESLSIGIEPDSIYCAKETVDIRLKAKKKDPKDPPRGVKTDKKEKKLCTTYNTHKSSDGCYWEHLNKGETCIYDHYCSWCKQNRGVAEKHKLYSCEQKTE